MPQASKSRKLDQFIVRFPDGMRERIAETAASNGRSMNAEIIETLERGPSELQRRVLALELQNDHYRTEIARLEAEVEGMELAAEEAVAVRRIVFALDTSFRALSTWPGDDATLRNIAKIYDQEIKRDV